MATKKQPADEPEIVPGTPPEVQAERDNLDTEAGHGPAQAPEKAVDHHPDSPLGGSNPTITVEVAEAGMFEPETGGEAPV